MQVLHKQSPEDPLVVQVTISNHSSQDGASRVIAAQQNCPFDIPKAFLNYQRINDKDELFYA